MTDLFTYLENNGFVREIEQPTIYVRGERLTFSVYTSNPHPNDKRSKGKYSKGQSKGRRIGLEEAGWIGMKKKQL